MSAGFIGWAVEALIASTLLMMFVLLVRKPAQRAIGTQLAYWLWALPVLRMVMPPLPAAWREGAGAPISAASETMLVLVAPVLPLAASPEAAPFPWMAVIGAAWLLGGLGFFAWHSLSHFSYVRRIVSPPARHERLPDGTTLVESDEAVGPVAFGVLRRFVAVPSDFEERYDADERKLALAHELGHHARGDLIANWIALAMLALHWFNPVAWVAYRKFRADQEMANDARVLAALPRIERHAYACAIVKAAHGRAVTAACHLHTIEDLKGRLRMLKASRKSRRVMMAGGMGIASLTVVGLGLTASGAAAEKIRSAAETQVVAIAQADVPAPPAAPVPPRAQDDWPETPAAPATPKVERRTSVVIVKDGKTQTFEGPEATAYLAANPDIASSAGTRQTRTHRIVIRDKDGKTRTYVGAEADAYLKAHPEMRPPVPPVPPVPGARVMMVRPAPGTVVMLNSPSERKMRIRQMYRAGPDGNAVVPAVGVEVVNGNCGPGNPSEFVRDEKGRDGTRRMIICQRRIERYAADQAKYGKRSALISLDASRATIRATQGLSDAQRAQALAGLDQARADLEREIREGKDD